MSRLTMKLVMISLEAFRIFLLLDCLYIYSIESRTNSFGHVWEPLLRYLDMLERKDVFVFYLW